MVKKRDGTEQAHMGAKADKLWTTAIRRAVLKTMTDKKTIRLDALAGRLVASGLKGETAALREIGDRLDGRPVAQVNVRRIGSFEDLSDDELASLARGDSNR